MGRIFGTDGARGVAVTELTCERAMEIGRAAAYVLTKESGKAHPNIIVGMDTRISSKILEAALSAGLASVGANALLLGVVPTPAVAYLVKRYNADAGVMISASHNTVEYNGIKLFSSEGFKLPDSVEEEIEALILDRKDEIRLRDGIEVGRISRLSSACTDYIQHIRECAGAGDYAGVNQRFCFDCANGSSAATARKLFAYLGNGCEFIADEPDGTNINDNCGSTHIGQLQEFVKANHMDIGFAFDGDADRCLAVDEKGNLVDGDGILYIYGAYMKEREKLVNNTVVTTIMSNFGLYKALDALGIEYEKTDVGDKYVYECMRAKGHLIGGEQSGHIIFGKYANTGDGILTAIKLMQAMLSRKLPLSKLTQDLKIYPQVLKNVKVQDKDRALNDFAVQNAVREVSERLGDQGRILLRKSGTEPVLRVMVEAPTHEMCQENVDAVIAVMDQRGLVVEVKG